MPFGRIRSEERGAFHRFSSTKLSCVSEAIKAETFYRISAINNAVQKHAKRYHTLSKNF